MLEEFGKVSEEITENGFVAKFKQHPISKQWQAKGITGRPSYNEVWTKEKYADYEKFLEKVAAKLKELNS